MKKKSVWFQTDLGYAATKDNVRKAQVISDWKDYEGRLTFWFKDFKDVTYQITTKGKIGIFYPEGLNLQKAIEKLKPYLVKADGSPASIKHLIKEKSKIESLRESTEKESETKKHSKFGFWEWLEKRNRRKRLEESRVFLPEALPLVESLYERYNLKFLKPFIEHDKEINKKLCEKNEKS